MPHGEFCLLPHVASNRQYGAVNKIRSIYIGVSTMEAMTTIVIDDRTYAIVRTFKRRSKGKRTQLHRKHSKTPKHATRANFRGTESRVIGNSESDLKFGKQLKQLRYSDLDHDARLYDGIELPEKKIHIERIYVNFFDLKTGKQTRATYSESEYRQLWHVELPEKSVKIGPIGQFIIDLIDHDQHVPKAIILMAHAEYIKENSVDSPIIDKIRDSTPHVLLANESRESEFKGMTGVI